MIADFDRNGMENTVVPRCVLTRSDRDRLRAPVGIDRTAKAECARDCETYRSALAGEAE